MQNKASAEWRKRKLEFDLKTRADGDNVCGTSGEVSRRWIRGHIGQPPAGVQVPGLGTQDNRVASPRRLLGSPVRESLYHTVLQAERLINVAQTGGHPKAIPGHSSVGRALGLGPRCRRFESGCPDRNKDGRWPLRGVQAAACGAAGIPALPLENQGVTNGMQAVGDRVGQWFNRAVRVRFPRPCLKNQYENSSSECYGRGTEGNSVLAVKSADSVPRKNESAEWRTASHGPRYLGGSNPRWLVANTPASARKRPLTRRLDSRTIVTGYVRGVHCKGSSHNQIDGSTPRITGRTKMSAL